MAGNTVQVGADGARRIKSNGIVVAGAADACCCTPPCSRCDAHGTPPTILLRCAGWSVTTSCQAVGTMKWIFNSLAMNVDFCLPICTVGLATCQWGDVFTGVVDADSYCGLHSTFTCGDTVDGSGSPITHSRLIYFGIIVFRDAFPVNTWKVVINISDSATGCVVPSPVCFTGGGGSDLNAIITATTAAQADCTATISCTIGATDADITAGTMQIIPNGC